MEHTTKENNEKGWDMVKAHLFMLMVRNMKENGMKDRWQGMDYSITKMEHLHMKDIGKKINFMGEV